MPFPKLIEMNLYHQLLNHVLLILLKIEILIDKNRLKSIPRSKDEISSKN